MKIDLHMHSIHSDDGQYTPAELIALCAESGVTVAALADHNSAAGVAEAAEAGKKHGVRVIPGIELDCVYEGVQLHLLGYGIDAADARFREIETDIVRQEQTNSQKRIALVRKLGIEFDDAAIETLSRDGVVTGEMIAEAALAYDKDNANALLDPYRAGGARGDNPFVNFYWDFCSQGKPAYVETVFISLAEAVRLVSGMGGVPILAHPGNNVHESVELLDGIVREGAQGLEVYSSYHSPAQVAFYEEYAARHHLLVTCGSDFHGKTKPSIRIGGHGAPVQDEILRALLEKMK